MSRAYQYTLTLFACSVVALTAFFAGVAAERFAAADACLDAGGVVAARRGFCVVERDAAFAGHGGNVQQRRPAHPER